MQKPPKDLRRFDTLLKVVEILRGPDGCPWDKEQTHASLTRFAIEESFELTEAIEGGQVDDIRDELGDVLFQVVLHSEIARQAGHFAIQDVIQNLNEKMVRRHPHVFSDTVAETSEDVLRNWYVLKEAEKAKRPQSSPSFDIPNHLPALMRSQKIGEKTQKHAFDWPDAAACWPKIDEELTELKEAIANAPVDSSVSQPAAYLHEEIAAEMGDVLFSIVQLARHLQLDAEQCLRQANSRFERRFFRMRELAKSQGKNWDQLPNNEKERLWKSAKSPLA